MVHAGREAVLGLVLALTGEASARGTDAALAKACHGRTGCQVEQRWPVGAPGAGEVVKLQLPEQPPENPFSRPCTPEEWWLLPRGRTPPRLLMAECHAPLMNAERGSLSVEVEAGILHALRSGGTWDRRNQVDLRLTPPQRLSEDERRYKFRRWVDWTRLQASFSRWDLCGTPGGVTNGKGFSALAVPQVRLPAPYVSGGWRTTALTGCSARVTSERELSGDEAGWLEGTSTARLSAVLDADARTLFLEVEDDRWAGPSARWEEDDHVLLWPGTGAPLDVDVCEEGGWLPPERGPSAWALRVADGQVFAPPGPPRAPPDAPRVEVVRKGHTARLKVRLPPGVLALTVGYADRDGEDAPRGTLTSSEYQHHPAGLSPLLEVSPSQATCHVRGGALVSEPAVLKVPPDGEPLLSDL